MYIIVHSKKVTAEKTSLFALNAGSAYFEMFDSETYQAEQVWLKFSVGYPFPK